MRVDEEAVRSVSEDIYTKETMDNKQRYLENKNNNDFTWLLDSGSTSHMTSDTQIFDRLENDEREIYLADKEGKKLTSNGIGEVVLEQSNIKNRIRLKNVLSVPILNTNLLSVAKMTDYGYKVTYDKHGAIVYKEGGEVDLMAVRERNSYYVNSIVKRAERINTANENDIWHKRLGHASKGIIEEMKNEGLVDGMRESNQINVQCESCVEGKTCRKTHSRLVERKTSRILELWHMDLIGPIKPSTKGGKEYMFTIIDDYSRVIFVQLLGAKSEAPEELKKLITLKENQSGMKLKAIRSDNGGEFIGKDLKDWLEKGVLDTSSVQRGRRNAME